MPPFLQEVVHEDGALKRTAVLANIPPVQSGANEGSRAWPVDPEARLQHLTEEVANATASIIGRKVENNEPLMAAGVMPGSPSAYGLITFDTPILLIRTLSFLLVKLAHFPICGNLGKTYDDCIDLLSLWYINYLHRQGLVNLMSE